MERSDFEALSIGLPIAQPDIARPPGTPRSDGEVVRDALNAANTHRFADQQTIRQARLDTARDMKRARQAAFSALVSRRTTNK